MTTTEMYQAAVAKLDENMKSGVGRYGTATHKLANDDELLCCVDRVAGKSITRGHYRTNWRLVAAGEQHSKPISHAKAAARLAE